MGICCSSCIFVTPAHFVSLCTFVVVCRSLCHAKPLR